MKPQTHFRETRILLLFLLALIAASCQKDKEAQVDNYLVSYDKISTYSPEQVQSIIIVGSIVYPEIDTLRSTSAYGVDIYKVVYKTTFQGNEVSASGIVSVPNTGGDFPVVSFQNGTNTCYSNAPSVNTSNQLYMLISVAAGNGFIITIPDYIGFGESGQFLHPYHHRESSDRAVIDLIQAAKELLDKKDVLASTNGKLFLLGYSQGGWATLSALKNFENNPIEGFTPVAASVGAGAYNLYKMAQYVTGISVYPNPFYLPYFVQSRIANGIMADSLSTYFQEPYASEIPGLFDGARCNSEMDAAFTDTVANLLTPSLISGLQTDPQFESLRQQLISNSVSAWNVSTPLQIYHSKGDKSVPWFESQDLYDNLLVQGVSADKLNLILVDNPDMDHNDAIVPWGMKALTWFISMK